MRQSQWPENSSWPYHPHQRCYYQTLVRFIFSKKKQHESCSCFPYLTLPTQLFFDPMTQCSDRCLPDPVHLWEKSSSPRAGRITEFKNWTRVVFCDLREDFFVVCAQSPHYSPDINQINKPTKSIWDTNTFRLMPKLCTSGFFRSKEGLRQQSCCCCTVEQFCITIYRCQIWSNLARTGAS